MISITGVMRTLMDFRMNKIFISSNKNNIILLGKQIIIAIVGLILGGIAIFRYFMPGFQIQDDYSLLSILFILFFVVVFLIVPIFLLICTIQSYLYDKDAQIIIDEANQQIEYQCDSMHIGPISLQTLNKWTHYHSNKIAFLEVNVLKFSNGDTIVFSNMIPLYEYLVQSKDLLKIPYPKVEGSVFKLYRPRI